MLTSQMLTLIRKLGLPEEYDEMFFAIQKFILIVQQAIIVINAFYAASGPAGWAILAAGAVGIAITLDGGW
jgi:hypothetical protein